MTFPLPKWFAFLALAPLSIAGCGGSSVSSTSQQSGSGSSSGSGSGSSQSPPAAVTSVAVTCAPATVTLSATSQCTATVQGTGSYSSTVTWSATSGTINASGLFTAPASAGNSTITATSTQDNSKSGITTVTTATQPAATASHHIVMVMEENQSYSVVVGSAAWPNVNNLIANGALATNYYADVHPSIGNYFMLTTGQVVTTNDSSATVWNVDNLARHMLAANVAFKIYAEGITQGYLGGDTGLYVLRHNPFALLSDVAGNPSVANAVLCPFSQFATDLANNALPQFSFIIPNLLDDAHDGTQQEADTWLLTQVVTPLSNNSAFQTNGDGVFIVNFDEAIDTDTTHGGGHVAPVFWGPLVKVGYKQTSTTVYQHESMLRTVMDLMQLTGPPGAAASAPAMTEFFVQK